MSSRTLAFSPVTAAAKSLQCPTLCDPIEGSPPGSAIPGILQARILEWVAISFSNAWKRKVQVKSLSCVRFLATPWTAAQQAPPSMGFSRQEYLSGVPLPSPLTSYRQCHMSISRSWSCHSSPPGVALSKCLQSHLFTPSLYQISSWTSSTCRTSLVLSSPFSVAHIAWNVKPVYLNICFLPPKYKLWEDKGCF